MLHHLAEEERHPPQPADPQLPGPEDETARHPAGDVEHPAGQSGWEVVERLAGQDDHPPHPLVQALRGEEKAPAPVGVDQRHVGQIQRLEELRQQPGEPAEGQVGGLRHRQSVSTERKLRAEVAEPRGQKRQHPVPQGGGHQRPVEQHDRRTAALVLVLDRSR